MSSFIEVADVCKKYGNHVALSHVNLKVPDGSIYGLLGPNGAGKTSLIRIINRITHADSGQVLMHGRPMTDEDIRHIGYLPEERGLYKKMKVQDEIVYLARLRGLSKHDAIVRMKEWLERFDLGNWRDKKVEQLSKGMAQKVQFIATVIHRPPLLIFDEPFSGFDPVNTEQLKREIIRLKEEGAAILFSTHNIADMESATDYAIFMADGKVIEQGFVEDLKNKYVLVHTDAGDSEKAKPLLLTYTSSDTGLEGLALSENTSVLEAVGAILERPTLQQLSVGVLRKAEKHEG